MVLSLQPRMGRAEEPVRAGGMRGTTRKPGWGADSRGPVPSPNLRSGSEHATLSAGLLVTPKTMFVGEGTH